VRAVLALGTVVGLSPVGTLASWTDTVPITGTTFKSGTIDLQLNDLNAVTSTTLSMTDMAPGATSSEVFRVKNAGSTPLTYTITGGLDGTDAAAFATASALKLNISANGTRSGTGNAATCTGGTAVVTGVALTANTAATVVGTAQGPLASGATGAPLCFQVTFASDAPTTLQGNRDGDVHRHRDLDAVTEHRLLRVLREVALTVGAVVGTLRLVFTLLSATVGVRPLVFTSGSMAPSTW
jgi:predicted ribosomally synthesized peptide with SipW-like signal peptide